MQVAKKFGADDASVFLDLGSGRGAPSCIAAYEHPWFASLGKDAQRSLLGAENAQLPFL